MELKLPELLMTKAEILRALEQMSLDDRLEVAATALHLIRQDRKQLSLQREQMAAAAKAAIPDDLPGGDLSDLWSQGDPDYC